jgi:uncharacterized protein
VNPDLLAQYRALVAKVDDFWDRAMHTQPTGFRCADGCDDCCGQRLTVFAVEANAIGEHLTTLDPALRARLSGTAQSGDRCAFLLEGRCAIYPARPIICRTHGLPIRLEGRLDHCPLNFTDEKPVPTIVLDLEQINTLLALVDRLHAEATADREDRPRVPLASLAEGKKAP